jgi:hypothetical protein
MHNIKRGVRHFTRITKYIIVTSLLISWCTISIAQVNVTMSLDSVDIFIGQQVQLSAIVVSDKERNVEFPTYQPGDSLISGVEVVAQSLQTKRSHDKSNVVYEKKYTITSFDSATFFIPPMQILVDGNPCKASQGVQLRVKMVPVDTANVDNFNPPYGSVSTPFIWNKKQLGISLLSWLFVVLFFVLAVPLLTKKALTKRKIITTGIAPFKQAKKEVDSIMEDEEVYKNDKCSKTFYMLLTDTLRRYINRRYGCKATEMTTDEILGEMSAELDGLDLTNLKLIFETADLAKFAKYESSLIERESHIKKVQTFLNSTKDESLENPKPTIETVVLNDGIQKKYRIFLNLCFVLTILAGIATLCYVLNELVLVFSY